MGKSISLARQICTWIDVAECICQVSRFCNLFCDILEAPSSQLNLLSNFRETLIFSSQNLAGRDELSKIRIAPFSRKN